MGTAVVARNANLQTGPIVFDSPILILDSGIGLDSPKSLSTILSVSDAAGGLDSPTTLIALTLPPILDAMSGLDGETTTVQTSGNVQISWDPVSGAISYRVKWGAVSGVYTNVQDVGNVTTYTLSLLSGDWYITVTAWDGFEESTAAAELHYVGS